MNYFDIDGIEHELAIYPDNIALANCRISGNKYGLYVYSSGTVKVERCIFTRNTYAVRWSVSHVRIAFLDCEFSSNTYGIAGIYSEDVLISNCRFSETSNIAFYIESGGRGRVTVQSSLFQGNYYSIHMDIGYPNVTRIRGNTFRNQTYNVAVNVEIGETDLLVENNTFVDLPDGALKVYQDRKHTTKHTMISNNTYTRIRGIPIYVFNADYVNVTVEKNAILNNQPSGKTAGIYMYFKYEMAGRIRLNDFRNNSGTNVVKLYLKRHSSAYTHKLDVTSNLFYDNVASQAVFVTNSELCSVTWNMFSNVLSSYDFLVTFGSNNLTAPFNWWGAADDYHVARRIWDQSDDPNLGRVLYEPVLTRNETPCEEVANCSGHGVCVRRNTCHCQSGWTGTECSQFTCADVGNCQDRGVCVRPNVCDCESGWVAPDCVQASCYDRNNCSGHGICVGPNRYVSRLVGSTIHTSHSRLRHRSSAS